MSVAYVMILSTTKKEETMSRKIETINKVAVEDVLAILPKFAPEAYGEVRTSWEFPGHVDATWTQNGIDYRLSLGEDDGEPGYKWDDSDSGYGLICGAFGDLDSAEEIARVFWAQVVEERASFGLAPSFDWQENNTPEALTKALEQK